MTVVKLLSSGIDTNWTAKNIKGKGCSVSLKGVPAQKRLIINLDAEGLPIDKSKPRCDFIFIGVICEDSKEYLVPIELKRGDVTASEVYRQIQEGTRFADKALIPCGIKVQLVPVIASGRIDKRERNKLRSILVSFRGQRLPIQRIKCGQLLSAALCAL